LKLQEKEKKESGGDEILVKNNKVEDLSNCKEKVNSNMTTVALQNHLNKVDSMTQMVEASDLVCLNVGGKKFFVMAKNFENLPNTRLANLVSKRTRGQILEHCDKFIEGEIPEYFFDRSWKGFNDILDCYRLGRLHLNSAGFCAMRTKALMEYWQIDELLLDPCCALKYYPEVETCSKEIEGQLESERKYQERLIAEDFGNSTIGKIRSYLWNLTEYPETSLAARITAFTSMSVVIISTVTFVLSTMPELTDDIDMILFDEENNGTEIDPDKPVVVRWEYGILALRIIDELTMWFFTLEYAIRFICSPNKWEFFKAPLNGVDLLAILPYFVGFLVEGMQDTLAIGRAGKVLRLIRVMRILRVFKLVRHFNGLQSLLSTLQQAYKELGLLMVLVSVTVLTFSSLIYFAEKESTNKWSFLDSFWWGLMTLTTVGYGSKAPATPVGQLIGGFCALIGVFILALPVPIVVNSFSANYKNRIWRTEVMMKKQERSAEAEKNEDITLNEIAKMPPKKCNGDASTTVESFVNVP